MDFKNGRFVNDDSVRCLKVDALYNPNLDDSECVFIHPQVNVLYSVVCLHGPTKAMQEDTQMNMKHGIL